MIFKKKTQYVSEAHLRDSVRMYLNDYPISELANDSGLSAKRINSFAMGGKLTAQETEKLLELL